MVHIHPLGFSSSLFEERIKDNAVRTWFPVNRMNRPGRDRDGDGDGDSDVDIDMDMDIDIDMDMDMDMERVQKGKISSPGLQTHFSPSQCSLGLGQSG